MNKCGHPPRLKAILLLLGSLFLFIPQMAFAADITGTVFRDYNANGVKDNSATYNEVGVGGVTVNCTDSSGGTGSATTSTAAATLGQYTLSGCTGTARVEFVWNTSTSDYSGPVGTGNNTSVQFVTAPATSVNFGINFPYDYSVANPDLPVAHLVAGALSTPAVSNMFSVVSDPYLTRNITAYNVMPTHDKTWATAGQTGSVYGLAYSPTQNKLYSSAYIKRHTQLGTGNGSNPAGLGSAGAIYTLTPPASGGGSAGVSVLLDIGATAGTTARTAASNWTCDPVMYEVGRAGWGDIDVALDGNTLWAMNLANRSLYKISLPSGSVLGTYPIPGVTGGPAFTSTYSSNTNLDFRPFGLEVTGSKVYVGVISSGESAYPAGGLPAPCNGATGTPQLGGYVFEFDINSSAYNTTPVLDFPFQGASWNNGNCSAYNADSKWMYWVPQSKLTSSSFYSGWEVSLRRPVIADLKLKDGNFLIGLRDINRDIMSSGIPGLYFPKAHYVFQGLSRAAVTTRNVARLAPVS